MIRALTAAVLAVTFAGCDEAPSPRLWEAFDLLVLGEDASGDVTLFRCPANDDISEWGEPEAVLRHPALAGGTCLTASDAGEAFVVTPAGVAHVASDGTITPIWSDEAMRGPIHLSFGVESQTAFVTDSAAACVFVVDASADIWRTERVIESEFFVEPVASRTDERNALEILDRGVDRLLIAEISGTMRVTHSTLRFENTQPYAFVASNSLVALNQGRPCLAVRADMRHVITCGYYPDGTVIAPASSVAANHRVDLGVPGVTPIGGTELPAGQIALIGTSESGSCMIVSSITNSAPQRIDFLDAARLIDIALVE